MKKIAVLVLFLVLQIPLHSAFGDAGEGGSAGQSQEPPVTTQLDDTMKFFVGNWKGTGCLLKSDSDECKSTLTTASFKPVLAENFLFMQVDDTFTETGKEHQVEGYLTYDPSVREYVLYWFDNLGSNVKFTGHRQDNALILSVTVPSGNKWVLTYTMEGERQYDFSLERAKPGLNLVSMGRQTYTKVDNQ